MKVTSTSRSGLFSARRGNPRDLWGERGGAMEKKVICRRDFMKSTLAGFGGFYFLTLNEPKQEEKPFDIKGKEKNRFIEPSGEPG